MTMGIFQESASAASLIQLNVTFFVPNGPPNSPTRPDTINPGQGNGNDCSGFFGKFDDPCDVGEPLNTTIAPIFAKLDTVGRNSQGGWSVNTSIFPSPNDQALINGFTVTDLNGNSGVNATGNSGTWEFSGNISDLNPNFTGITHWSSKGGNGFVLSWMVDADDQKTNDVCDLNNLSNPTNYNKGCLNAAIAVNSGNWFAPEDRGLSHISFYGREIPEPSTTIPAILFGLAGWYGRKKSTQ